MSKVSPSRTTFKTALLIAAAFAAAQLLFHQRVEIYTGDASRYIGLARNLLDLGSYEFNFRPHTRFPPGIPVYLAGIYSFLPDSFAVSLLSTVLFAPIGLLLSYLIVARRGWHWTAAAGVALLASSPYFFHRASEHVASDFLYMALSTGALLCAEKLSRSKSNRSQLLLAAAAALLIAACLMVRSIGVAFLAALPLWFAAELTVEDKQTRRPMMLLIPAFFLGVIVFLSWSSWQNSNQVELFSGEFMHSYRKQVLLLDPQNPALGEAGIGDLAARVGDNLVGQAARFSELTFKIPWVAANWFSPLVFIPLLFGAIGLIRCLASQERLLESYVICYTAIVLLWPFEENARFLLPTYPFILMYTASGLNFCLHWIAEEPRRALDGVGASAAAIFLLGSAESLGNISPLGYQKTASLAFWAGTALFCAFFRLIHQLETPVRGARLLQRKLVPLFVVVLPLIGVAQSAVVARANLSDDRSRFLHEPTANASFWLKENIAGDKAVMAGQEAIVHFVSGLKAIPFPVTDDPAVLKLVFEKHQVGTVVVIVDEEHPYFLPAEEARIDALIKAEPGLLEEISKGDRYVIYRVANGTNG